MLRIIFCLLTIVPTLAAGQIHCIKTDLFGYAYPLMAENSMRSVYGFKASMHYEYIFSNRYSLGASVAYGYSSLITNIRWNGSSDNSPIIDVTVTKGAFLSVEGRRYFRHISPAENEITSKGLYLGVYIGLLRGKDMRYQRLGLFDQDPFYKTSEVDVWTYGIGPFMGYKFNIGEQFLVEPQLGFAFSKSKPPLPANEPDFRFLHLTRIDINVGYLIYRN